MQSDRGNVSESASMGDNGGLKDEFEANGFIFLKNAIPYDCIQRLHDAALMHAEYIFEIMRANGHQNHSNPSMNVGVKNGFREIVLRCPGRYEMSIQNRHWNAVPEHIPSSSIDHLHPTYDFSSLPSEHYEQNLNRLSILGKQIQENLLQTGSGKRLIQVAKDILRHDEEGDDDIYTCNISVVIAEPGAAEQKWHADGGHLCIWKHLPCHCLNIFLPLVDITEELGPTELRPGESSVQRMLLAKILSQ